MSDVDREALHDWLDHRAELRADAMPDRPEYEDEPEAAVCPCGAPLEECCACAPEQPR